MATLDKPSTTEGLAQLLVVCGNCRSPLMELAKEGVLLAAITVNKIVKN